MKQLNADEIEIGREGQENDVRDMRVEVSDHCRKTIKIHSCLCPPPFWHRLHNETVLTWFIVSSTVKIMVQPDHITKLSKFE